MLKKYLHKIISGENLNKAEAVEAMTIIMSGEATTAQIGSFLTALKLKGEANEEIVGFVEVMRSNAKKVQHNKDIIIDTCGTGGDTKGTFNVSTTVAFVLAAAGLAVAKHGNRSVSSACGSADVLSALGVNVSMTPEKVAEAIDKINIGFLFAPEYNQAMKHVAVPRRELGFRTIFNLLGPLANPAGVKYQMIGIYDISLTEKIGRVLADLGVNRAMVFHSYDGLDEISSIAPTKITEVIDGEINTFLFDPKEYGFGEGEEKEYVGGGATENATILENILKGETGAKRDIVIINAGVAFYITGFAKTIQDGIKLATETIDKGLAFEKLNELRNF